MGVEIKGFENEKLRLYEFECFDDGSGYRAMVGIVSGCFSCSNKEFFFEELEEFHANLKHSYNSLSGCVSLKHRYEKDFINFEFTRLGQVFVSGELNEYSKSEQSLYFSFSTDQTYILEFIKQLAPIVDELHL